ncbi:hypothetical protein [Kocuria sp.]|uniref:hypothetical protein n=1 Tax=Kocuria sp. TaxID=1871328 RepID=UPI0026DB62F6|nr:hypothetical protein [Kocuria sp.]MDO4918204.1 hypothetical protein [Kocuria sp.]
MAETVRQIPPRYGAPQHVFHPRIGSYGRRIGAALPPLLVVALAVAMIYYRRPAGPVMGVLGLFALVGVVAAYAYLRPALAVLTEEHVLLSRWVGFRAVPRERIVQVVTVERLIPQRAPRGRTRGRPQLWFVTGAGRCALALDGTVWDGKSLQELARLSGAEHVNFSRATPAQVSDHWPRLVSWRIRYPRLRYAATSAALLAVVALLAWWAFSQGTA